MHSRDLPKERLWRSLVAACALPTAILTGLLWAALGLGQLGRYVWSLDLLANFRVQYMVLFALCVIALTVVRWRKTALVALLGVAFTTATMAPFFQERTPVAASGPVLRLITFNTWFRNEQFAQVVRFLQASDADVVVLQEINVGAVETLQKLLPQFGHQAATRGGRHALVILSRWPLQVEHLHITGGMTRISRARIDWNGNPVTIVGTHLNWPLSRQSFAQRTHELQAITEIAREETRPLIVAGDFNLTPWSPFYGEFVAESGLKDCALGQGLRPTWPAQAAPLRIRIDLCFTSEQWRVQRLEVGPKLGSDHLPVIADLELMQPR